MYCLQKTIINKTSYFYKTSKVYFGYILKVTNNKQPRPIFSQIFNSVFKFPFTFVFIQNVLCCKSTFDCIYLNIEHECRFLK